MAWPRRRPAEEATIWALALTGVNVEDHPIIKLSAIGLWVEAYTLAENVAGRTLALAGGSVYVLTGLEGAARDASILSRAEFLPTGARADPTLASLTSRAGVAAGATVLHVGLERSWVDAGT